jgi:hypothetical protein
MNIEQDIARSILAGKLWTLEELEVAADVEAHEARVLVTEWLQGGDIQQADTQHFYFTDSPPPPAPEASTTGGLRQWTRQDTVMVTIAGIALVCLMVSGALIWSQSNQQASLPPAPSSLPSPSPHPTLAPTATPEGWHELQHAVVGYYAPEGDVAFALNPGEWYQPVARAHGTTWIQLETNQGDFWVQSSELRGLELHEAERLADLTPPTPVAPTPTERVVVVERVIQQPVYQQQTYEQQAVEAATPMPVPTQAPTAPADFCPPPDPAEVKPGNHPAVVTSPDDIEWDLPEGSVSEPQDTAPTPDLRDAIVTSPDDIEWDLPEGTIPGDDTSFYPRQTQQMQEDPFEKPGGGEWTIDDVLGNNGRWNVWAWLQVGDTIVPVGISPTTE